MTRRDYEAPGITVHWDSDLCIHAERCTTGAPAVFDRSARPWVDPTAAPAGELARVIDTCPSGALTYTRTDAAGEGRHADGAGVVTPVTTTAVTITPQLNGPLAVRGPVHLVRPDGTVEEVQRATLCRCGHSSSKPRCDGTHARVGFTAPGVDGDPTP